MTKSFLPRIGASENTLEDGRVLVPGEKVELSADDLKSEYNKRLIESGQIVEVKPRKKKETTES